MGHVTALTGSGLDETFLGLVHLVLASCRGRRLEVKAQEWVNDHLLAIIDYRWTIAAPLTFAVLEGIVRRKNYQFMNPAGIVTNSFKVINAQGRRRKYSSGRVNSICDALRCFEQKVLPLRGRTCPYLTAYKMEMSTLFPPDRGKDVYDLISYWRNDTEHGNMFWPDRVSILLNLICLLIIDEIEPSIYNSRRVSLKGDLEFNEQMKREYGERHLKATWEIFPPDLE